MSTTKNTTRKTTKKAKKAVVNDDFWTVIKEVNVDLIETFDKVVEEAIKEDDTVFFEKEIFNKGFAAHGLGKEVVKRVYDAEASIRETISEKLKGSSLTIDNNIIKTKTVDDTVIVATNVIPWL